MRSLIKKVFFGSEKEGVPDSFLKVPPPVPIGSLHENQRRACIAWIAIDLANSLNWEQDFVKYLIYLPYSKDSFLDNKDEPIQHLLYVAERMVTWVQEQQDVYMKIREMNLAGKYHESFLQVYEAWKQELMFYLLPARTMQRTAATSEEDQVWSVYRDVMFAATQRKFLLIKKNEVPKYKSGELLCEVEIKERADIPKARDRAKESLLQAGIAPTHVMSYLLVISEAITNILKHAKEGKMVIVSSDSYVHVLVEDKGPGFPLDILPKATLMAGYSTKKSLGQGFTLMMKMAEQVLLATDSEGATVILVFNGQKGELK